MEKGSEGGGRTDRARRVSGSLESIHLQPADCKVGDPEAAGPVASDLFGASVVSTGTVLWQDQGKSLQSLVSTQESKSGRSIVVAPLNACIALTLHSIAPGSQPATSW